MFHNLEPVAGGVGEGEEAVRAVCALAAWVCGYDGISCRCQILDIEHKRNPRRLVVGQGLARRGRPEEQFLACQGQPDVASWLLDFDLAPQRPDIEALESLRVRPKHLDMPNPHIMRVRHPRGSTCPFGPS